MSSNRLQNLQTLRIATADVAVATAFSTLVTGAFLVGFIKLLGGSDLWVGLVSAIPQLLGLLQIPGAIWGRGFGSYKRFVAPGAAISKLGYLPLIALPLLPIDNGIRLTLLILVVTVASIAGLLVSPMYNDWIAELVPPSSRGWYFSRRSGLATAVGAGIGILGGLFLDGFRKADQEATGLAVVFGLGGLCAIISLVLFMSMADLERTPVRQSLREGLKAVRIPFSDRRFRSVLFFLAAFMLGQGFAGNLYSAYAIESLRLPFTVIQGTAVSQAIGILAAVRMWGFLADKYGNKPMLILSGLGIASNPIAWLLTSPGHDLQNKVVLLSAHLLMGVFWAGVGLCQFNLLLATAPPEDRTNYLGAGLTLQAVVSGIAPLLGAFLMAGLRAHFDPVTAYKGVFVTALVLRGLSVLFIAPVHEEGSTGVRSTLRDLRRFSPRGLQAMRSLAKNTDVEAREQAIESVGEQGFALASDTIVRSLRDPQPRVRRQAAKALAQLGDPQAAGDLISHLERHPDLVEEETIEALGELGNPAAAPILLRFMESPSSILRRTAARALGRIGDPAAIAPLIDAAAIAGDIDLRRAALQALRMLDAREAESAIADALYDPHPSVRIAAAEAVSEMKLTGAAPNLRQSLEYFDDEASSELAYALGTVGELSDLPTILQVARRSVSSVTRRRGLLGAARLLDVEAETYRLMLLDGMARDRELVTMLRRRGKRSRRAEVALRAYVQGDEAKALRALERPELEPLAAQIVQESFLIGAAFAAKPSTAPLQEST